MKKYRAKFNPTRKGVYAVSLVDEPAMEGDFIQFQKEHALKFAQVDANKRRVMGLILEPNKEVLRFDKEENSYYTVYFEAQDIEDVAYNFQKQGNQNNSTIQHDGKSIEGVSFVETWIVENPKVDKSTNFGFEYPKGSWMGVMQLDNQEVWDEYVQTGKVKGFSIDAFMQFEEQLNLNKVDKMDEQVKEDNVILSAIKDGFTQLKEILSPKKVDEVVEEVKEVILADEPMMDQPPMDDVMPTSSTEELITKAIDDLQAVLESMKSESASLSKKVDELEVKLGKQDADLLELGKQPATASIKKTNTMQSANLSAYEKFREKNKQFNK